MIKVAAIQPENGIICAMCNGIPSIPLKDIEGIVKQGSILEPTLTGYKVVIGEDTKPPEPECEI